MPPSLEIDQADQRIAGGAQWHAPRAAAVAGILFSLLLIASFLLIRLTVPADPLEAGAWLHTSASRVVLALNLLPFAGIAFLWFIAVVRDRLGDKEDRFFATVFLGSGLLFLTMLFMSAAMVGGLIIAYTADPGGVLGSATFSSARAIAYEIMNIYGLKMAGVFMISTSTLAIRTRFLARWLAWLGYPIALLLLLGGRAIEKVWLAFPFWVLLISVYILIDNYRHERSRDRPRSGLAAEPDSHGTTVR